MKTLYLIRHAKSSWDNSELSDFDRPLNKRGEKNAPEMGIRLNDRGVLPDLILSSPAKRALTTAKEIARKIDYEEVRIIENKSLYHAHEVDLISIIKTQDKAINSLMMFGHNPGFTDLANMLTISDQWFDNIPTCGIVAIAFEVSDWTDISLAEGKLLFYDYPKKVNR